MEQRGAAPGAGLAAAQLGKLLGATFDRGASAAIACSYTRAKRGIARAEGGDQIARAPALRLKREVEREVERGSEERVYKTRRYVAEKQTSYRAN
jgi:hypothetical protein